MTGEGIPGRPYAANKSQRRAEGAPREERGRGQASGAETRASPAGPPEEMVKTAIKKIQRKSRWPGGGGLQSPSQHPILISGPGLAADFLSRPVLCSPGSGLPAVTSGPAKGDFKFLLLLFLCK